MVRRDDDAILLRTRPPKGLLGGMAEPPTSEWRADYDAAKAVLDAPFEARWRRVPGVVTHVFTHFPLELTVLFARAREDAAAPDGMRWTSRHALGEEPLPSVMKKVLTTRARPDPASVATCPAPAVDLRNRSRVRAAVRPISRGNR